jgi:uncharacterized iron-regulated membrane protein
VAVQNVIFTLLEFALITWLITGFLRWNRLRSSAARERAAYKQRLPTWIKSVETYLLLVLLPLSLVGLLFLSLWLHGLFHAEPAGTLALVLIMVPDFFFAMMFSMLAINFLEWVIRPLKRVNEKAAEGLPAASWRQTNRDFLHVLGWAGPAGLMLWICGLALR